MAGTAGGYWPANYWSTYWGAYYWGEVPASVFAADPITCYWPWDYWAAGYWDPHYWGSEPGPEVLPPGRAHPKRHVVPSIRRFIVPESEVRAEIREAIAKAAAFEEQRQLREHEDEEWQRREYYRKLGLRGVEVKQERAKEEDDKRKATLRNLEQGRQTLERMRIAPSTEPPLPPPIPQTLADRLAQERTRLPKKPDISARVEQLEAKLTTVQNALDQLNAERERQEQIKRDRLGNLKKARKAKK